MHAIYDLDLLDFFRGRYSWEKLERLIGQLPSRSRLALARAEDEELAEAVLDQPESLGNSAPPLEDWTPEVGYLAAAVDRLGEVVAATIAAAGGKPPKVRPLPRPKTALDYAKARRTRARHDALVAEVEAAQARRD